MTPELAAFSDWVLALLPRLFLFPGGLWMLVGLGVVRIASRGSGALRPQSWATDLAQANLAGAAVAWAALALLPLPGIASLPTPIDRWVLVALLAVSFMLDLGGLEDKSRRWIALAGAGITLALLVPLAHSQGLLETEQSVIPEWARHLATYSFALGLITLVWAGEKGIGSEIRSLAWVGVAIAVTWANLTAFWLASITAVAILGMIFVLYSAARALGPIPAPVGRIRLALLSQWLLALAALLVLLFVR